MLKELCLLAVVAAVFCTVEAVSNYKYAIAYNPKGYATYTCPKNYMRLDLEYKNKQHWTFMRWGSKDSPYCAIRNTQAKCISSRGTRKNWITFKRGYGEFHISKHEHFSDMSSNMGYSGGYYSTIPRKYGKKGNYYKYSGSYAPNTYSNKYKSRPYGTYSKFPKKGKKPYGSSRIYGYKKKKGKKSYRYSRPSSGYKKKGKSNRSYLPFSGKYKGKGKKKRYGNKKGKYSAGKSYDYYSDKSYKKYGSSKPYDYYSDKSYKKYGSSKPYDYYSDKSYKKYGSSKPYNYYSDKSYKKYGSSKPYNYYSDKSYNTYSGKPYGGYSGNYGGSYPGPYSSNGYGGYSGKAKAYGGYSGNYGGSYPGPYSNKGYGGYSGKYGGSSNNYGTYSGDSSLYGTSSNSDTKVPVYFSVRAMYFKIRGVVELNIYLHGDVSQRITIKKGKELDPRKKTWICIQFETFPVFREIWFTFKFGLNRKAKFWDLYLFSCCENLKDMIKVSAV